MKEILQDFSPQELEALVIGYGEQKFRAKQIFQGLMQGKKLSELPVSAALREKLLERFEDEPVRILEVFTSSDGTKKYLFALADGNLIEGVLMQYKYGATQCVSTQVGCRMGCKFCALYAQRACAQFNGGGDPFRDPRRQPRGGRHAQRPRRA